MSEKNQIEKLSVRKVKILKETDEKQSQKKENEYNKKSSEKIDDNKKNSNLFNNHYKDDNYRKNYKDDSIQKSNVEAEKSSSDKDSKLGCFFIILLSAILVFLYVIIKKYWSPLVFITYLILFTIFIIAVSPLIFRIFSKLGNNILAKVLFFIATILVFLLILHFSLSGVFHVIEFFR